MRSWGNRQDCIVSDEPLYAFYLSSTGRIHPGREATLAGQSHNWREVRDDLLASLPPGKNVFYQKHMAHHLLPEVERDWLNKLTNCFLIREPREMLTSLIKKLPDATLADTGLPQQVEIFRQVCEHSGSIPPVIDSKDVLLNPRGMMISLCSAVQVDFTEDMLHWPTGKRDSDGPWAPYWYAEVEKTTTFGPYRRKDEDVPGEFTELLHECVALYDELAQHRVTAAT